MVALLVVMKAAMSARESSLFAALRLSSLPKSQPLVVVMAAALFALRNQFLLSIVYVFVRRITQSGQICRCFQQPSEQLPRPFDQATMLLLCCVLEFFPSKS